MKTGVKIQELSDGRFRNTITGKIGDSVRAVVGDGEIKDSGEDLKTLNSLEKHLLEAIKRTTSKVSSEYQIPLKKIRNEVRKKRDIILKK